MLLISFLFSKKINDKAYAISSCLISYILISLVALIRMCFFQHVQKSAIIDSGIAIILGSAIVIGISILLEVKSVNKFIVKIFHKTVSDNIWKDSFDFQCGSNLKVYLKDKDYYIIGHLKNMDEKEESSWITLSAFAKFNLNTNKKYEPSYLDKPEIIIAIRLSDIEHIEIF